MSAAAFTFEGIAALPSRASVLREGVAAACRCLDARGTGPDRGANACSVLEDGSAVITVAQRPSLLGGPIRQVRIAIRVKEVPTDVQATESLNAQATETRGPRAA